MTRKGVYAMDTIVKVYDKLVSGKFDGISRDGCVYIRCSTYEEWCDLYRLAKSIGYSFSGLSDEKSFNYWYEYAPRTYLVFCKSNMSLMYGSHSHDAYPLDTTDLYDKLYAVNLGGDVMAVLEC